MAGGDFILTGGFWSLLSAVQTPGAPLLTITLTATNTAVVSWPLSATGFLLQQNSSLHSTNWMPVPGPFATNGESQQIIISHPQGQRYFRLVR
jgi:hypothetical protein